MRRTLALHGSFPTKERAKIKDLQYQEPRPLLISNQTTVLQVSALNLLSRDRCSPECLCFCPLGWSISQTKQESGQTADSRGTCDTITSSVRSYYSLVSEDDRGNTALWTPVIPSNTAAEHHSGFNPLKALLETISAAHADRQVRPQLPACSPYFANKSL